jgi:hypothetical protein
MTDIKTVKVDKCGQHLLLQNILLSVKLQKSCSERKLQKTKSVAAQLVLQPAYSKKLSIGDKNKADNLNPLRKKSHFQIVLYFLWVLISINIVTFKALW